MGASANLLSNPVSPPTPSKGARNMPKLRTAFVPANHRRDVLLGRLRKAHRDLARAESNLEARRKALIAIEETEQALWQVW
jgi:hypothetical protein